MSIDPSLDQVMRGTGSPRTWHDSLSGDATPLETFCRPRTRGGLSATNRIIRKSPEIAEPRVKEKQNLNEVLSTRQNQVTRERRGSFSVGLKAS